jgi:uncharacterized protein YodC (DUF2158 family)
MPNNFKVGDVVILNTGGSIMTVNHVNGSKVFVQWFVGTDLHSHEFDETMLTKVNQVVSSKLEGELLQEEKQ